MRSELTTTEAGTLSALEECISKGQKTFIEVGCALAEIRDSKLYRADFKTFEDYCRVKWGWSKPYCTQLIGAARVVESLPESAKVAIATESQARELAKVEPERRVEVIELAAQAGPLTARSIREAAKPTAAPEPPAEEDRPHIKTSVEEVVTTDAMLKKFRIARQSQGHASKWWWSSARPYQRGEFLETLICENKPVTVHSKDKFKQRMLAWIERNVTEVSNG
jgi:hypothetical protein